MRGSRRALSKIDTPIKAILSEGDAADSYLHQHS